MLLNVTNKMQRFIVIFYFCQCYALHVSGGFSAHHQELIKLYTQYRVLCIQFYELLMMGGKTA